MSQQAGINLAKVFNQYLRDFRIPVLEYKITGKKLQYRWTNCVAGFDMPVAVNSQQAGSSNRLLLSPTTDWKTIKVKKDTSIELDTNFYVEAKKS